MRETGSVQSSSPENDIGPEELWDEIFARFRAADVPEDFMRDSPLNEILEPHSISGDDEQLNAYR